jgi:hypothetical protein
MSRIPARRWLAPRPQASRPVPARSHASEHGLQLELLGAAEVVAAVPHGRPHVDNGPV